MYAPNTSPDANTDFAEDETRPNSVRIRDLFLRTIHNILANFKDKFVFVWSSHLSASTKVSFTSSKTRCHADLKMRS